MPLAVATYHPEEVVYPDAAMTDLLRCINLDSGLIYAVLYSDGVLLGYDRHDPSYPAQYVDAIVNSTFDDIVIINAVDSNAYIEGEPITVYGGGTFPPESGAILLMYDWEECNGNGYHVFDENGWQIANPRYVILFHELAHAFQYATYGVTNEVAASEEENQLRFRDGLDLRDPTNEDGGCDTPDTCFIATAARSHFRDQDLDDLYWIRDMILRRRVVSRSWFDRLFTEYDQYSARIAAAMDDDPALRQWIYLVAVGPLLHFYTLLRDWLFWRTGRIETLSRGCERGWHDFVAERQRSIYSALDANAVLRGVGALLKALDGQTPQDVPEACQGPEWALAYVRGVMLSTELELPLTRWAIVEPLMAMWSQAPDSKRSLEVTMNGGRISDFLKDWIQRIPDVPTEFRGSLLYQLETWALALPEQEVAAR
jgi:hypothetical protein